MPPKTTAASSMVAAAVLCAAVQSQSGASAFVPPTSSATKHKAHMTLCLYSSSYLDSLSEPATIAATGQENKSIEEVADAPQHGKGTDKLQAERIVAVDDQTQEVVHDVDQSIYRLDAVSNLDDDNTNTDDEECIIPDEVSQTQKLLQQVKEAGTAGAISYALWELAFWAASVPVCSYAFYQYTGHWPDFANKDDVEKLGAEAFAFVNVARFAVPLRIGLALSTAPWINANVLEKYFTKKEDGGPPICEEP